MSTRTALTFLVAIALITVPIVAVLLLAADAGSVDLSAGFNSRAAHYPEAVERLQSTSETLVTVTLATLGGAGLLLVRARSIIVGAAAIAVFACSVFSLYYATKLGYSASLTLATDQGDITRLAPLLDNQALAALVAGLTLAVMACLASFADYENRKRD